MFHGFMVFYAQYAKDHLPSQTGQRKSNQVDQHGRKQETLQQQSLNIALIQLPRPQPLPTYLHEKPEESPNIG